MEEEEVEDVVEEDSVEDMEAVEEEVVVTLEDKDPNVTNATGLDILPGNVVKRKIAATSVTVPDTLQGTASRMRILATIAMRLVTL